MLGARGFVLFLITKLLFTFRPSIAELFFETASSALTTPLNRRRNFAVLFWLTPGPNSLQCFQCEWTPTPLHYSCCTCSMVRWSFLRYEEVTEVTLLGLHHVVSIASLLLCTSFCAVLAQALLASCTFGSGHLR